jgi:hypothetical protein
VMVLIGQLQYLAIKSLEAVRTRYMQDHERIEDSRFLTEDLLDDLTEHRGGTPARETVRLLSTG